MVRRMLTGIVCFSFVGTVFAANRSAAPIADAVRAVVRIEIQKEGVVIGNASGIVTSTKGHIATAKHVVEDAFGVSLYDIFVIPTGIDEKPNRKCQWKAEQYASHAVLDLA